MKCTRRIFFTCHMVRFCILLERSSEKALINVLGNNPTPPNPPDNGPTAKALSLQEVRVYIYDNRTFINIKIFMQENVQYMLPEKNSLDQFQAELECGETTKKLIKRERKKPSYFRVVIEGFLVRRYSKGSKRQAATAASLRERIVNCLENEVIDIQINEMEEENIKINKGKWKERII
ncbi:hypothetical protein C1645_741863 [Glomus cerebriforme]|uniref:Uncharacterized protein n=1 Tax=Glomus cerebriforme TaxID=658196 RepID=A0A397SGC2_9GLOM|nr:hypothetical protein C1645_741863 [Glomus cerebriforme]